MKTVDEKKAIFLSAVASLNKVKSLGITITRLDFDASWEQHLQVSLYTKRNSETHFDFANCWFDASMDHYVEVHLYKAGCFDRAIWNKLPDTKKVIYKLAGYLWAWDMGLY